MSTSVSSSTSGAGSPDALACALPSATEQARWARRRGWLGYFEHYLRTMRGYGWPVLAEMLLSPLLYLTSLGIGLAALVDRGHGQVQGVPYLVFVAPALMVSTTMQAASTESTFPVMGGFKWHRLYWGASSTALTPAQIATGHELGAAVRYLFQATWFWLMMLAFGATHAASSVLTVPIAVLGALAFGAPLQAYAATLTGEGGQFNYVNRFLVMPMTLFAGTFFPLSSMPVYLRWIGWISPWWHATQLARRAAWHMPEPLWLTVVHVVFLVALTIAGTLWARHSFTRRLTS